MPLQIEVPDDDIKYLNKEAKDKLNAIVKDYADEILSEAGRLEKNLRSTKDNPQITSSMINDAAIVIRRGYRNPPKSTWLIVFKIGASVTSGITGLIAAYLSEPWGPVAFAIAFAVSVLVTTVTIVKDSS